MCSDNIDSIQQQEQLLEQQKSYSEQLYDRVNRFFTDNKLLAGQQDETTDSNNEVKTPEPDYDAIADLIKASIMEDRDVKKVKIKLTDFIKFDKNKIVAPEQRRQGQTDYTEIISDQPRQSKQA